MIRIRSGTAGSLLDRLPGCEIWQVAVAGEQVSAVAYPFLCGEIHPGDILALNTTARYLKLGSGGFDFIIANLSNPGRDNPGRGHIMKLRYTPLQVQVESCEEDPARRRALDNASLKGQPVIIGELHSMLSPAAAALKARAPGLRTAYMMTDGGALPLAFSRSVAALRKAGLIDATVTCGHAFGGDYEAITPYSGLLAAKVLAGADVTIVAMGPGIVGTGSRWGFTGIEVGEMVNRVSLLGGVPIVIPRISFADPRPRHRGISHHTLTSLSAAALKPAVIVLPTLPGGYKQYLWSQLRQAELDKRHRVVEYPAAFGMDTLARAGIKLSSMGRGYDHDPAFFQAALAAGAYTASILARCSHGVTRKDHRLPLHLPGPDCQPAGGSGSDAGRQGSRKGGG